MREEGNDGAGIQMKADGSKQLMSPVLFLRLTSAGAVWYKQFSSLTTGTACQYIARCPHTLAYPFTHFSQISSFHTFSRHMLWCQVCFLWLDVCRFVPLRHRVSMEAGSSLSLKRRYEEVDNSSPFSTPKDSDDDISSSDSADSCDSLNPPSSTAFTRKEQQETHVRDNTQ